VAITYVGEAEVAVIDGGVITLSLTGIAGLAQDDIVLAVCFGSGGTAITPSGGWTNIELNGTYSSCYKIMTSSPDTSITFHDPGASTASGTAIALALRGVDTTTPLDGVTPTVAATSGVPDPAAIVPASDDCAIVAMAGNFGLDASVGTISDYTTIDITSDDNSDTASAIAYRILTGGAGVSQNPAAWSTWASSNYRVATVALRPAAATGQPTAKRMGGVEFVQSFRRGQNSNLWRKAAELLLPPRPSIIRV
jgi:hypothetical protein